MTSSVLRTGDQTLSKSQNATLVDVRCVAEMLDCSARHVYRMADSGQMPRPLKLGSLVRWHLDELTAWIGDGCPSTQAGRTEK